MIKDRNSFNKIIVKEVKSKGSISTLKMTMLGVGGVIGAGFFLASGIAIRQAGPAILINTVISAFIMFTVFQALTEMSIYKPVEGSFRVYAEEYAGKMFGFLSGWFYWIAGILVMSSEVTASAIFTSFWFPHTPLWMFTLFYSALIIIVNLMGAEDFSSIESIFSAIKLSAIVAIITMSIIILILFKSYDQNMGISNLTRYGGFFPNGIRGFYGAMLFSQLSFAGIEITAMAAYKAHSKYTMRNTVRNVVILLTTLYIGSFFLLLTIVPWNIINTSESPFVKLFAYIRLPFADSILNFVILTAALTTMNAAMYGITQVLLSLSKANLAPKMLSKENKAGTPVYALTASSLGLLIAVIMSYLLPKEVYEYITSSAGIIQFTNWLIILFTHLKFRRYIVKQGRQNELTYKARGYPYTTWAGIAGLIIVMFSALTAPKETVGFIVGITIILSMLIIYKIIERTLLIKS